MTKVEKNRVIRVDIINLDNEKTSICQQHVLVKDGQRLAMLHQSSISFLNRIFMTGWKLEAMDGHQKNNEIISSF